VALRPLAGIVPAAQPLVEVMTAPLATRVTDPAQLLELVRTGRFVARPTPAKGYTVLCFADEIARDPAPLAAAARELEGVEGATIAIYAPDASDETLAALEPAVEAAGISEALDLVVLAVARTEEAERDLARRVDAVATRAVQSAPFDALD